jgi:YNFM family putative membrane transporter
MKPVSPGPGTEVGSDYIEAGTRTFWRVNIATVAGGFCTFALIYCVQPLMPLLADTFQVTPTQSSLALSFTTGMLAIGMLATGIASEMLPRKSLMAASLVVSALLTVGAALAPTWHSLLVTRALAGFTISGFPAVAMAYVSEEIHPKAGGLAMGLYIGGNAFGGMSGRLVTGVLTDLLSWRWAIGLIGALGICASLLFWCLLPPSRHFTPHSANLRVAKSALFRHLHDRGLLLLFAMGFLIMGSFVSVYNYLSFRLVASPYGLSQTAVGLLFTVYSVGMFSSAWAGNMATRHGSAKILMAMVIVMLAGLAVTLSHPIWTILAGLIVFTFGFFGAHAVVSAWIGRRAQTAKAVASSFYLFSYYAGSSVSGTTTGLCWSNWGWHGVSAAVAGLLIIGVLVVLGLKRLPSTAPLAGEPITVQGDFGVP